MAWEMRQLVTAAPAHLRVVGGMPPNSLFAGLNRDQNRRSFFTIQEPL